MNATFPRLTFFLVSCAAPLALHAQFDFSVDGRNVQVHSFASQGFLYSNQNNYLTTNTSQGSFSFTDGGANISTQITDKFRVGAQVYLRNVGELGNWHPQLDWAYGDYKFASWFGVRAGKVKTALGLFNDTQDNESLFTWGSAAAGRLSSRFAQQYYCPYRRRCLWHHPAARGRIAELYRLRRGAVVRRLRWLLLILLGTGTPIKSDRAATKAPICAGTRPCMV